MKKIITKEIIECDECNMEIMNKCFISYNDKDFCKKCAEMIIKKHFKNEIFTEQISLTDINEIESPNDYKNISSILDL